MADNKSRLIHRCSSLLFRPTDVYFLSVCPRQDSGSSTNTAKIPSHDDNDKSFRPANIPLHTLSSSSRYSRHQPASGEDALDEKRGRSRPSSVASDSDFSLWSDTGDLVDELPDDEADPLTNRLRDSWDPDAASPTHRHTRSKQKRVRYTSSTGGYKEDRHSRAPRRKEDIPIPNPSPRVISKAQLILAAIMAPRDGPSRMHGLHGKKLLYA